MIQTVIGTGLGTASFCTLHHLGVFAWTHEVIGHGYLGNRLVYSYEQGSGPLHRFPSHDAFVRSWRESHSVQEKIYTLYARIFTGRFNQDFPWTESGPIKGYTLAGRALGPHGRSSWIAISGPLTDLCMQISLTLLGYSLQKNHPLLGSTLKTAGIAKNLYDAAYPLLALDALKKLQWNDMTRSPSDFIQFTDHLAQATSCNPRQILTLLAKTWIAIPAMAYLGAVAMHPQPLEIPTLLIWLGLLAPELSS